MRAMGSCSTKAGVSSFSGTGVLHRPGRSSHTKHTAAALCGCASGDPACCDVDGGCSSVTTSRQCWSAAMDAQWAALWEQGNICCSESASLARIRPTEQGEPGSCSLAADAACCECLECCCSTTTTTAPSSSSTTATTAAAAMNSRSSSSAMGNSVSRQPWGLTVEVAYSHLMQLQQVYVILFGADGPQESEGIYSVRALGQDGLPTDTVVAFESRADAERYCGLVGLTMGVEAAPSVWGLPPLELAAFCCDHAYLCRLELEGSTLTPPRQAVGMTDWERALRLRQGTGFHVLDQEPVITGALEDHPAAAAAGAAPAPPSHAASAITYPWLATPGLEGLVGLSFGCGAATRAGAAAPAEASAMPLPGPSSADLPVLAMPWPAPEPLQLPFAADGPGTTLASGHVLPHASDRSAQPPSAAAGAPGTAPLRSSPQPSSLAASQLPPIKSSPGSSASVCAPAPQPARCCDEPASLSALIAELEALLPRSTSGQDPMAAPGPGGIPTTPAC